MVEENRKENLTYMAFLTSNCDSETSKVNYFLPFWFWKSLPNLVQIGLVPFIQKSPTNERRNQPSNKQTNQQTRVKTRL